MARSHGPPFIHTYITYIQNHETDRQTRTVLTYLDSNLERTDDLIIYIMKIIDRYTLLRI
jgi:hypothetical protein